MKLIDFKTFEPLERLRKIMGAEYVPLIGNYKNLGLDYESIQLLETKGININIEDLSYGKKDKTLQYKGRRVILYIRDWTIYSDKSLENSPKFHISYCQTIHNMFKNKKKERYVIASRNDGLFLVNRIENNQIKSTQEIELEVCSHCLDTIAWMGYHSKRSDPEKQEIKERFTLENFFKYYPKDLIDSTGLYCDEIAKDNLYPRNWQHISNKTRKEVNWSCEQCGIMLEKHSKFLDVHHINGIKSDSDKTNLKVLCVECHSNIHPHMKNNKRLKEFLAIKNTLSKS